MTKPINFGTPNNRKPRLALMGEFSSGKSTLSNLLLGEAPLPMRVTATRLPPVWITEGEPAAYAVLDDGSEQPVNIEDLENNCPDNTRMIRLHRHADILQVCDLIDMPGISDPNMPVDSWRPIIEDIDCVIWCTHATQAWRQSEAAMWDQISGSTNGNNILLVTQFDKLRTELEGARVLNRLKSETRDKFRDIFTISLLQAIEAGDDFEIWRQSGAAEFTEHLIALLLNKLPDKGKESNASAKAAAASSGLVVEHVAEVVQDPPATAPEDGENVARIRPKRVRIKTRIRPRTPRPSSSAASHA
ncbi:dynamin family protein [Marivita hallyeonensis]|uniref:Dynamin family protein n=1 Tax=Marivita hallyeonensis TaxID=996342 RepID=A0A1M5RXW8_9RHOB|nr:dynamin family protein [Marivita hallyeonensis]SHH31207.1 Dynamin family protein [Marivita hallyeonensis]